MSASTPSKSLDRERLDFEDCLLPATLVRDGADIGHDRIGRLKIMVGQPRRRLGRIANRRVKRETVPPA